MVHRGQCLAYIKQEQVAARLIALAQIAGRICGNRQFIVDVQLINIALDKKNIVCWEWNAFRHQADCMGNAVFSFLTQHGLRKVETLGTARIVIIACQPSRQGFIAFAH